MATTSPETILKKEIRKLIREAIKWNKVDDGIPTFWSSENYKRTKKMKGLTLGKKEQNYVYYTRSERAIKEIAEKIFKLREDNPIIDKWFNKCVKLVNMNGEEMNLLIANSTKSYTEGYADGQMLGIKSGLEVAKAVCKREGYEFTFPNPESIKIEKEVKKCIVCVREINFQNLEGGVFDAKVTCGRASCKIIYKRVYDKIYGYFYRKNKRISENIGKENKIKINKNKKGWGRSYGYPKPSQNQRKTK